MNLFPHEKERPIQKAFLKQVAEAVKNKQNLVVHAPTGLGKTTALAPVLEQALEKKLTVFFLTSRHTQHQIAIETLKKIKEKHSIKLNVIDLVGKKGMCAMSGVASLRTSEFYEYCKDLREKGKCYYFNNIKVKGGLSVQAQTTIKKLHDLSPLPVEEINEMCSNDKLCPYETACLAAKDANVIIADYNHLLNSHIRENILKRMDKSLSECIVIIDEAHNLPKRARELRTCNVSTFILDQSIKEARPINEEMANDLVQIRDVLSEVLKNKLPIDKTEALVTKNNFYQNVIKIGDYQELSGNFRFIEEQVLEMRKRSFVGTVAQFMEGWLGQEEGFARIISRDFDRRGKPVVTLSYRCLDPSVVVFDLVDNAYCTIAMSGTLTPTEMYVDLFGMDKEKTITVQYGNPFPAKNRLNLIVPKTTTKYSVRGKAMYELIGRELNKIINNVPGNVAIFFPSYRIRDEVYEEIKEAGTKTMFLEQASLTKEEKEQMIETFKEYKDSGAVILGASSGSLGEGIDLPGDLLQTVVVVGLPLGKPDLETEQLIAYYDKKFGRGWDYGYVFPAMIKTMQNAGRCIRSETDRGVIVFLEERYAWKNYLKCFPSEWDMEINRNPEDKITKFFNGNTY